MKTNTPGVIHDLLQTITDDGNDFFRSEYARTLKAASKANNSKLRVYTLADMTVDMNNSSSIVLRVLEDDAPEEEPAVAAPETTPPPTPRPLSAAHGAGPGAFAPAHAAPEDDREDVSGLKSVIRSRIELAMKSMKSIDVLAYTVTVASTRPSEFFSDLAERFHVCYDYASFIKIPLPKLVVWVASRISVTVERATLVDCMRAWVAATPTTEAAQCKPLAEHVRAMAIAESKPFPPFKKASVVPPGATAPPPITIWTMENSLDGTHSKPLDAGSPGNGNPHGAGACAEGDVPAPVCTAIVSIMAVAYVLVRHGNGESGEQITYTRVYDGRKGVFNVKERLKEHLVNLCHHAFTPEVGLEVAEALSSGLRGRKPQGFIFPSAEVKPIGTDGMFEVIRAGSASAHGMIVEILGGETQDS